MKLYKRIWVFLCLSFALCIPITACARQAEAPDDDDDDVIIVDGDDDEEEELPLPQTIPNEELAGNVAKYALENVQPFPESELNGKTIYWLGSSVTYGDASMGEAMPDYIAKRNGAVCIKEAVSGTTLMKTYWSSKTYTDRLIKGAFPKDGKPDLFVCQLSTNDMYYTGMNGEPTADDVKDISAFNKNTTYGAIEYIIAYVKQTWNCKIAFYSNPYFEYKNYGYGDMVAAMSGIAKKWNVEFWNMYGDKNMSYSQFDDEKLKLYMRDWIHPTRAGYLEWWTPYFEEKISAILDIV